MLQCPLLQTKLHIPRARPERVPRPRLIERLNAGLDRKLTLVSAPAGFGKTTLISEWVESLGGATPPAAAAWLSLDEGDNDPTRFLAYLVTALRTIDAGLGQEAVSALQSPQPPPNETVLTSLINGIIAIPGRNLLVLDDYHLIDAQPAHDALSFLLEHLPQQLHMVIATREDPTLPLARLRARGQLTEIRAADLRFTTAEAADFLNRVMSLDLGAEEIAALETRTEGWIAGLQLTALALQGMISRQGHKDASGLIESLVGSHRYVLDYLIEEVLEQQSESVQAFLLQTSVLDRLTGSLCDAVRFGLAESPSSPTGAAVRFGPGEPPNSPAGAAAGFEPEELSNGQATLEMLERTNLFIIPLDEERHWYRYHHLFAGLLRQRLRQTQADWIPTLHRRASEWHEQNEYVDEAIEHALRAQDFERVARLIEQHADTMWACSEHAKLRRWLAKLPRDVILRTPLLCLFHAWFLYAKGPRDEAEQYLRAAEQALESGTDGAPESMLPEQSRLSDSEKQRLRGRVHVIRAFMASYQGDAPAIIERSRLALATLPGQDLIWRSTAAITLGDALGFKGDMEAAYQARLEAAEASATAGSTVFSLLAYMKVAITLREQGRLQRTIEVCRQQVQHAGESGLSRGSVAGCMLAMWGEVLAELGDLEGALPQTRRGVDLAEQGGDWSLYGWSCLCLIRVLFSAGDVAGAQELVRKVEDTARDSVLPPWITSQIAAWQTRLWLAQDRLEAASHWVRERGLAVAGDPRLPHEFDFFSLDDHVMLARVLIAQDELDEADRLLPRLLEAAEAGGRISKAIEILNLQALAFQAMGDQERALNALEQALLLAEPAGFVRTFVDEGPSMAGLLYEAATHGNLPDYASRLLAAFAAVEPERAPKPSTAEPKPDLVEPLSDRELEVLHLIADGLTNQEIAARLFLSLNTIKVHTRNIYGKLNVHSRTQAIVRAREVGLLPGT